MKQIKLVFTDIDGVWTDGGMYYDNFDRELKKFNTVDGGGVLFLKLLGIDTVIITGEDTEIVRRRAKKLGVRAFLGVKNKLLVAEQYCQNRGIDLKTEVGYIGDDINDLPLLRTVIYSAAPSQAPEYVKKYVRWITKRKGGEGAFREFVETLLDSLGLLDKALDMYLQQLTNA